MLLYIHIERFVYDTKLVTVWESRRVMMKMSHSLLATIIELMENMNKLLLQANRNLQQQKTSCSFLSPLSTPKIRYQLVLMPSFEQCHTSNYERFKFWCRKRDFTLHSPFECFMICLLCAMCVSVECWMMPTLTNINFYHFHSPLTYKNASQCVMDPQLMCFFLLVGFTSSIQRVPSE